MSPEEACRKVGCNEKMYCFGGKDKTVKPRICGEAQLKINQAELKEKQKNATL
jgi:hypothetical protein